MNINEKIAITCVWLVIVAFVLMFNYTQVQDKAIRRMMNIALIVLSIAILTVTWVRWKTIGSLWWEYEDQIPKEPFKCLKLK